MEPQQLYGRHGAGAINDAMDEEKEQGQREEEEEGLTCARSWERKCH
jgi:hypothetical protein